MAEIKIQIEGYEGIDVEKSDFSKGIIILKKKEQPSWRYNKRAHLSGYVITRNAVIEEITGLYNISNAWHVFATKKQAKSMLAMAQLSQIVQNDKRFGGPITDEEWNDEYTEKYIIVRSSDEIRRDYLIKHYHFLAFHTQEQRDLFLEENMDLIRQYYMLD